MWKRYAGIPIKELSLWDKNARFPEEYFNKSEKELIAYFLSDEKFAKKVVAEFEIPQFEQICVFQNKGKKIVLEGNRRLTVYKLLCNPLLTDNLEVQGFFKKIKIQIKIDEDFILDAHITDSEEDAFRFLNRKHYDSNNEVPWGGIERSNFAVRSKKPKWF